MEHNNIYIYYKGVGESILGKPYLFVFPNSETLTTKDMERFIRLELTKRIEKSLPNVYIRCVSVSSQYVDRVWRPESRRSVSVPHYYGNYIDTASQLMTDKYFGERAVLHKNRNIKSKMDVMVKLYEGIVAKQSPSEANLMLEANDIIYYDAQKLAGPKRFDKRSPEGKALISAKRIVQREKLLTQRGYSIKSKRRGLDIGMSRLELQDN